MKTERFATKRNVVKGLETIETLSRHLSLKLVALGYAEVVKVKETAGRGRAKVYYKVNGKGRGLIALSKQWK